MDKWTLNSIHETKSELKKCLLPKCLLVASSRSDDFRWEIHSPSEKFWKFPFNVGDKVDLSPFVSKKRGLLNGFNIPDRQTNLQMKTFSIVCYLL